MTYSFATGGSGWTMVPCMTVLLGEIRDCVNAGLLDVTNLGQLGDARHQAEPTSRHNPARAPDGNWYVCAADFGGKDYAKLAYFHQALYKARDLRVYPYGFSQRGDGYGLSWTDGNWKWTGRDQGHCHFDVNMATPSLGANWWTPTLASTAPWGLADWLRGGNLGTADLNSEQIQSEEDDMADPATQALLQQIAQQAAEANQNAAESRRLVSILLTQEGAKTEGEMTTINKIRAIDENAAEARRLAGEVDGKV